MRTDITVVLDRSGSMQVTRTDAMNGFNALVEDQKRLPGEAWLSLVQFDDQYQLDYTETPIAAVAELTPDRYQPRGRQRCSMRSGRRSIRLGTGSRPDLSAIVRTRSSS